jgi:hypothetical protein
MRASNAFISSCGIETPNRLTFPICDNTFRKNVARSDDLVKQRWPMPVGRTGAEEGGWLLQ